MYLEIYFLSNAHNSPKYMQHKTCKFFNSEYLLLLVQSKLIFVYDIDQISNRAYQQYYWLWCSIRIRISWKMIYIVEQTLLLNSFMIWYAN